MAPPLFLKHLKLLTTLRTPLLVNSDRRDSQNPAQPNDDGGKRPLGFHILTPTLRTLGFYSLILNNHRSASLDG